MKVLVTGNAGFVGSNLADALVELGHEVDGIDNLYTGKAENIHEDVVFRCADIINKSVCEEVVRGKDVVFHTAALARIQPSIDDPYPTFHTNVVGTVNLLEACRKFGTKIVFSSSSSIYKGDRMPLAEPDPVKAKNPYSLHKMQGEEYIRLYHELYGVPYTIFRYFNVYGPRQILEGQYAALVGIFLQQHKQGKPLTITNDGEQRRDFTHVEDVVMANLMALDGLNNDTFNVGTGTNYSVNELAALISDKTVNIGDRIGEARETLADNTKLKSMGWKPTKDIKDYISEKINA